MKSDIFSIFKYLPVASIAQCDTGHNHHRETKEAKCLNEEEQNSVRAFLIKNV